LVFAAREAGVGAIVQSGTDVASSRLAVDLAESYDDVWATVGFHPHDAAEADDLSLASIEELARSPVVVAVGETGLDFYRDRSPRDRQEHTFVRHLEIARAAGLPVVVHTREAETRTFELLAAHAPDLTVVLHCFSAVDHVDLVIERGYYLSFAGNVTYKNAPRLRAAAAAAPRDRILVETDAPYLAPEPLRGRPNSPALVPHTYRLLAQELGLLLDQLADLVAGNVARAYPRIELRASHIELRE